MKAKLIDEKLVYAPNILVHNNVKYIGGVPEEILIDLGYKDVIYTDSPEADVGYYAEYRWVEKETTIEQEWGIIEDSPESKVAELKYNLEEIDYQAIKYAEGWITEEDYAPIKAQRQLWRDKINELENEE